jgi:hypothetical protein
MKMRRILLALAAGMATMVLFAKPAMENAQAADSDDAKQARAKAEQVRATMDQMKMINLGILVYESANGCYPPAYKADKAGKPLLSWRVLILPYVEHAGTYKQFHLDEPWDSDHNKTLIAKMPSVFQSPKGNPGEGKTNFLTVRGKNTIFSNGKGITIGQVKDGTSCTLTTVEADDDRAVIWTKPDDFDVDEKAPSKGLGGLWSNKFFFAGFADGSVHQIMVPIAPAPLNAFFSRDGEERIDMEQYYFVP